MNRKVSLQPMMGTLPRQMMGWTTRAVLLGLAAGGMLALLSPVGYTNGPRVYAIKDARIVTVTNGTLAKGTVVLRDGLIEAVGAQVKIPGDARIIDGSGLTVYPGLIDAHTDLALKPPRPARGPGRGGGSPQRPRPAQPPEERPGMHPDRLAADQLQAHASQLEKVRSVGITTALTIPRSGIFIGQSALINLVGDTPGKMVVKSPVAMHIGFRRAGGFFRFPGSLMGVISYIRQTLLDAQHYRLEWDRYRRVKRGLPRPELDKALDTLQPVLARDLPVVFIAREAKDIRRVIKLAEEFHLKPIISGATEGYEVADMLRDKQIPVLVSLNFPKPAKGADPKADVPLRVLRQRVKAPTTPAALYRAGVKFAFTSGFMSDPKDIIKNAAKAIKAGLPREQAVKAFTISPAEIFGVSEQLGSIETGKIANLVVADGNLFNEKTRIKHVFIDGREIELKKAPEKPGKAEAEPTVDASGTWELTVESPQGPIQVTVTLQQTGTKITGTLSSMFGESNTEGSVSGASVRFKALIDAQGQSMEVEFEGKIEGNTMKGTVSVQGQGEFSFTGTRPR